MKFGLEVEKFLFDLRRGKPSEGVFRFIDALTDLDGSSRKTITNEFVLNMVEIVMDANEDPLVIINDYLSDYIMFNTIARREQVAMVGLGSMPMRFQPHMSPKWAYFVQNSILDKKIQSSWMMSKDSPLTPAGNCAGIHVHAEIDTLPEYLFSNRELQDKFNLGLMLTPMIAFSSSPYFFGEHDAASMRGLNYYDKVYKDFPLNGGLPHVMNSSEEVLKFFQFSSEHWITAGTNIGLPQDDLEKLIRKKGASWNPVRWNRTWNTIELRCMDSDRIDYDCAKFVWATSAFKRMDLKGEALQCQVMEEAQLSTELVSRAFEVNQGKVNILPTLAIKDLFQRAIKDGVKDDLVYMYLHRLCQFALPSVPESCRDIFEILQIVLANRKTTGDVLAEEAEFSPSIDNMVAGKITTKLIDEEKKVLKAFYPMVKEQLS